MSTTYHCCIDLGALARMDSICLAVLRHYGAPELVDQSNEFIAAQAVIKRAQGMEAWPLCAHHDARGMCKGHKNG